MDEILGEDLLGDELNGVEDMLGDELMGEDVLGRVYRAMQRRAAGRAAPARRAGGRGVSSPIAAAARRALALGATGGLGRPLDTAPDWRAAALGPGVNAPVEGLYPLPLVPDQAGGVFLPAGANNIRFVARPQKPFRAERLLAIIRRSAGAAGVDIQSQAFFVGTDLQQAFAGAISLDNFAPNSVGVRLALSQAYPGIEVSMLVTPSIAVPVGESVSVNITLLGRIVA